MPTARCFISSGMKLVVGHLTFPFTQPAIEACPKTVHIWGSVFEGKQKWDQLFLTGPIFGQIVTVPYTITRIYD